MTIRIGSAEPLCKPPDSDPNVGLPLGSDALNPEAPSESSDPALCECARFGKRSLSWAVWLGPLSGSAQGGFLDRHNLEFSHEHIAFEASGDNIGYGPHGPFSENLSDYTYHWENRCYDGSLMRETLRTFQGVGAYDFFRNNCQDFASAVKQRYQELARALGKSS